MLVLCIPGIGTNLLRNTFNSADLILAQDGKWYSIDNVRWDSRFDCTLYPLLRDQYKVCRHLFRNILKVKSTDLADLIAEIRHQSQQFFVTSEREVVIGIMRNLLRHLDSMLGSRPSKSTKSELQGLKMFPIAMHEGQLTLESAESGEFWIPDIPVLHECFRGRAPLLDLTGRADATNINSVVAALGLSSRLLTEAVQDDFDVDIGKGREDAKLTQDLRRKVQYIQGYARV